MKIKPLKVLSVCSGVEALGKPFTDSELFKLIGVSEVDKHCNAVLRYLHPKVTNYGDLISLSKRTRQLPNIDVLIGGTPCQNLSMGGKREGLRGAKSRLFFNFVKIIKRKRPKYFIWENVEGTLTSQEGWDFAIVQDRLASAGYSFRWEVLTAVEFGVPQIRSRVFIVGVRRGKGSRKLLCGKRVRAQDAKKRNDKNEVPEEIQTVVKGHKGRKLVAYSKSTRTKHLDHRMRVNHAANTLNTGVGGSSQSSCNYIIEADGRMRMLTPKECERTMGWQDDHTRYGIDEKGNQYEIPDGARYSMCGNGVVSDCVVPLRDLILENEKRLKLRRSKQK